MPRPAGLRLDTSALHHNLTHIRRLAPHSKTWALVKANAYGHRIEVALPHLRMTTGFAVCDVEQGVELRKNRGRARTRQSASTADSRIRSRRIFESCRIFPAPAGTVTPPCTVLTCQLPAC